MEKKSTFPKKSPTPDFGSFALEIWPKNTTNFRPPSAARKEKARVHRGRSHSVTQQMIEIMAVTLRNSSTEVVTVSRVAKTYL